MPAGRISAPPRAASEPGKLCGPEGPGPRGAGAPPTRGWPFRRGAAIRLRSPRRARARVSRRPREGAEAGGWWPLPSARDKGAHTGPPEGMRLLGRTLPAPRGSLGSGGWGRPGGSRSRPGGSDRVSCCSFVLPRQVS